MNRFVAGTMLAALIATAAASGNEAAKQYFGNTFHVIPDKGSAHYVYYNPDNTFEMFFPDKHYKGTYKLQGNQVCLTAVRPGEDKESTHCYGFDSSRKPGDSWTETTPAGVMHFRLDAGRAPAKAGTL